MNKEKRDRLYAVLCTVLTIVFISVMLFTVEKMPDLGRADNPDINEVMEFYVEEGPEETGALNAVTGMILHYRAFDTLGESNVLFAAACIVLILLRADRDPRDGGYLIPELRPEPAEEKKDFILRGTATVLVPAGILYGISMVLNGHLSAGGGFSGGAVIGAALILCAAAYGPERLEKFLGMKTRTLLTWAALMVYTLLKTYSFYTGANGIESIIPLGTQGAILSGGLILPLNICVGMVVACTMYAFYCMFRKGSF